MIDSGILIWLWSKVYTSQSNINYRPSGCLRSPTVGIQTINDIQSVLSWCITNNISSNNEKNHNSCIYDDKSTRSSFSSRRNNHIFCVMMTRFRDSPQLLIKCKSSEKNYLQLLKAFYSNNDMLLMWLTLGQGHDTSSCHEQPLCNFFMNFLCFFFFFKLYEPDTKCHVDDVIVTLVKWP